MPPADHALIGALKKRLKALDAPAKKSDLLRAGLRVLSAMDDVGLKGAVRRLDGSAKG